MKELTIIIPAYKKPKSLRRLLNSIEKFTSRDLTDVIVVFDDGEVQELPSFAKGVLCGNQTGAIMAIWKGVLMADSKVVGVLGDDTELITPYTDEIIIDGAVFGFVIGLNDGIQEGRAHPFMWRDHWLEGLGLSPCYRHYFSDTELYKIAKHHDYWRYIKECKILHHHIYAKNKGLQTDILEETTGASHETAKLDGQIHRNRMMWWEAKGKPIVIPWSIT